MKATSLRDRNTSPRARVFKLGLAVVTVASVIILSRFVDVQQAFRQALTWISDLGAMGPLVFVLFYIMACVLLLPGSILTLGAGAVFGVIKGTLIVSIASTAGATCAFLVGRYLARDWVGAHIAGNDRFKAIDEAVGAEGWKVVGLTRLSPIFPFNLLNYAFGLTRVRLQDYVLASWIGMLPGTVLYVYIGSLAGDLAVLGSAERSRGIAEWVLYGVGLLATLGVTFFVTRLAKRALHERIAA